MSKLLTVLSGGGEATIMPLDAVTNAAAAYSFRKLRAAYAGSAVRLRRDSDNTEQDIGFSGNNFDTVTAASFIGGGNGFGTTKYDQAATFDLTQTTADQQPLYGITGGAGGKPGFTFDGIDDILTRSSSKPSLSTGVTVFMVAKYTTDNRYAFAVGGAYDGAAVRMRSISPNHRFNLQTNAQSPADLTKAGSPSTFQLMTGRYDASSGVRILRVNGGTSATETLTASNLLQNTTIMWYGGAQHSTLVFSYLGGIICELIVYASALSDANVAILEADIATYYGLTLT